MLLKLQKPGEIFLNKNFVKIIMNLNDFFPLIFYSTFTSV